MTTKFYSTISSSLPSSCPLLPLPQRASGDDLPNEILLQIFPSLDLRSLIAARGVDRRWRNLVLQAYLPPGRDRLLQLYLSATLHPAFVDTREDVLPHVRNFDREDFVKRLPENLPDEFEIWIREWPTRSVIGWIWPGLEDVGQEAMGWNFLCRCNCLAHSPPYVKSITYHERIKQQEPHHYHSHRHPETVVPGFPVSIATTGFGDGISTDAIYYATAFLPVGVDITLGGGISWLDSTDDQDVTMVSIELIVLCVCKCITDGRKVWLVLDGKRGGEKLKGAVYLGSAGLDLRPEDVVAKSWSEFLQAQLNQARRRQGVGEGEEESLGEGGRSGGGGGRGGGGGSDGRGAGLLAPIIVPSRASTTTICDSFPYSPF